MSLATIRAAIRARLDTLKTDAPEPGPFVSVGNWAGEFERASADGPSLDALGEMPCALIAFARETPTQTKATLTGEVAQMLGLTATVLVVAVETGTPGEATGLLDPLIDAVLDTVTGTRVGSTSLLFEGWAPHRVRPGLYCYAISFRAVRQLSAGPTAPELPPLERVDGDVNPVDADPDTDSSALPLATVRAEFPDTDP